MHDAHAVKVGAQALGRGLNCRFRTDQDRFDPVPSSGDAQCLDHRGIIGTGDREWDRGGASVGAVVEYVEGWQRHGGEDNKWQMANDRWQMADGKWQMADNK